MIRRGSPCTLNRQPNTIEKRFNWLIYCLPENKDNAAILDIGCGIGVYEQKLERKGFKNVIGIDVDEKSIKQCASTCLNASFIQSKAEYLPFRESSFDVILMIEVLEHVDVVESTLEECHRVLKEGGILCITTPNRGFPFLTHGFRLGNRYFDNMIGIPLPFATYLPIRILEKIWCARCFRLKNLDDLLKSKGFKIEKCGFLMPAFDDCGICAKCLDG